MQDPIEVCEKAARAGGAVLMEMAGRFSVREKGPRDLVTEADLASQTAIRELLLGAFPDHGFLGEEEAGDAQVEAEYRWIVDPLDGTTNYVHQAPQFCVSVALERRGQLLTGAVFDPVMQECYTAAAGQGAWLNGRRLQVSGQQQLAQALVAGSFAANVRRGDIEVEQFINVLEAAQAVRRGGSAALNLCYVAAGRYDAYWSASTKAWDVAAGVLLVREAGGYVTALDGGPFELQRGTFVAAATTPLHAELSETLQRKPPGP